MLVPRVHLAVFADAFRNLERRESNNIWVMVRLMIDRSTVFNRIQYIRA